MQISYCHKSLSWNGRCQNNSAAFHYPSLTFFAFIFEICYHKIVFCSFFKVVFITFSFSFFVSDSVIDVSSSVTKSHVAFLIF